MTLQKSHRKTYDGDPKELIAVMFTSHHKEAECSDIPWERGFFFLFFLRLHVRFSHASWIKP